MTAFLISVLSALLLIIVLRLVYARLWSKGLSAELEFGDEYVYEGDKTKLMETLSNSKLLPLPSVEIGFSMSRSLVFSGGDNSSVSDMSYRRDVFSLGMRQRIVRTLDIDCKKRGHYNLDSVAIVATDLFLRGKYLSSKDTQAEIFVLPGKVPAKDISIPFSKIMGTLLSRSRIYDDPFEFAGIREYRNGDPMKYINWKSSAKSEKMLVNIHDSTLSQDVEIIIDAKCQSDIRSTELCEEGIRIAAALSSGLLAAGINITMLSNGTDSLSGKEYELRNLNGVKSLLTAEKSLSCLETGSNYHEAYDLLCPQENDSDDTLKVFISPDFTDETNTVIKSTNCLRIIPYSGEMPETAVASAPDTVWWRV